MSYVILGRAIKNEYLALGTLFSTVGLTLLATSGKKEAPAAKPTLAQVKDSVKIGARSSEEEELMNSIKQFIADAEKDSTH